MNRRGFLGLFAMTMGACAANRSALPAGAAKRAQTATIVLVHGAWHGGWCWQLVEPFLRDAGLRVYAPTLTGLAERAHLRTPVPDLSLHIEDVTRLIEWQELEDIVLVGHSYGGMIITAVADRMRERIRHVVYLDAALPADGENMLTQNPDATAESVSAAIADLKRITRDGIWLEPFPAPAFGIPPERPDLIAWVNRRMTPHPLPTWTESVRLSNGGSEGLPRTYLHCTKPVLPRSSFPAHALRIRRGDSGTGWRYRELGTGHDAMIIEPDAVAREILALSE